MGIFQITGDGMRRGQPFNRLLRDLNNMTFAFACYIYMNFFHEKLPKG